MLATDDVSYASMLFVMADHQVRETAGVQQTLHGGLGAAGSRQPS
jgi:hypothetical protein